MLNMILYVHKFTVRSSYATGVGIAPRSMVSESAQLRQQCVLCCGIMTVSQYSTHGCTFLLSNDPSPVADRVNICR